MKNADLHQCIEDSKNAIKLFKSRKDSGYNVAPEAHEAYKALNGAINKMASQIMAEPMYSHSAAWQAATNATGAIKLLQGSEDLNEYVSALGLLIAAYQLFDPAAESAAPTGFFASDSDPADDDDDDQVDSDDDQGDSDAYASGMSQAAALKTACKMAWGRVEAWGMVAFRIATEETQDAVFKAFRQVDKARLNYMQARKCFKQQNVPALQQYRDQLDKRVQTMRSHLPPAEVEKYTAFVEKRAQQIVSA